MAAGSLNLGQNIVSGDVRAQIAAVENSLTKLFDAFIGMSADAMYNALTPTFAKSQLYCPVKTGRLKESGYLEIISKERNATYIEMGYGAGGDPPYTVYVHETPAYHKPPTRYKWLETAVLEDLDVIWSRLVKEYTTQLGQGT